MKVFFYCQHVLGMGHFFRALAICEALRDHDVCLVTGGDPVAATLPSHVRRIGLPELMMDADFSGFHTPGSTESVDAVMASRREQLAAEFQREAPDLFLVELYPFGRKAFRFEIDPILSDVRSGRLPPCKVVCSLRDILVEKTDADKYERRVVDTLNRWFDAVLVHSDPKLVSLSETFSRLSEITIPVRYTGFVGRRPPPDARERVRARLGLADPVPLILASAGGGNVGGPLMDAVLRAFRELNRGFLQMFTGPFLDRDAFDALKQAAPDRCRVERFTDDFLSYLAAADVSVSMAGYNTCMNLMAARVPALVWPFGQNREQRFRAERLARFGGVRILEDSDLAPDRLASLMARCVTDGVRPAPDLKMDGAEKTAVILETLV